jgi:hypothetical protein
MFACMNPANDVGKKELPAGIRNRFTEIFVSELQDIPDLNTLVFSYLQGLSPPVPLINGIVRLVRSCRLLCRLLNTVPELPTSGIKNEFEYKLHAPSIGISVLSKKYLMFLGHLVFFVSRI